MKPEAQKIVLGAGYLYFAANDADGNPQGERYLGDTPGFTITPSSENLQVYSSDGPVAELLEDITTQVTREASITAQNVSIENLAAFLVATAGTHDQTSDQVTGEEFTVSPGHWYQLGETDTDYRGVRNVSNVAVTLDPGGTATSLTEDSDYTVESETGRIYIMPSGQVSEGATIGVDYDTAEASWDTVETHQTGPARGKLRFVAANTTGPNRDVLIPSCQLAPDGELPLKSRDQQMQMQFALRVNKRGSMAQIYVDGRPQ